MVLKLTLFPEQDTLVKARMNTQRLARATPKIARTRCPYRLFTTSPPTSDDPLPQRPQHAPLPSNVARNASRAANRDANIAHAISMMHDVDRSRYSAVRDYDARRASLNDLTKQNRARDLERQMPRLPNWQVGDVYAPHDLSAVEAAKWRKRKSSDRDVFDVLGINPLGEYKVCVCGLRFLPSLIQCRGLRRETWSRGWLTAPCAPNAEFLNDVRIHDAHGPDQTPAGHGPARCQPAEDRKGHQESGGDGAVAERA